MTRSKQTTKTKPVTTEAGAATPPALISDTPETLRPELPPLPAGPLELVTGVSAEATPDVQDTLAAPAVASISLDRLMQTYSTAHMPDTSEMELQDGSHIRYKLLKGASAIIQINTRAATVARLCEDAARVEKEWPELLPFLPLDFLLLRDAVTAQDCLLPPFAFTLPQAVQLGKSCGSLLSDIATEIRRMSEPAMWPKPAQTATQDTQEAVQDTSQPMQEAA